LAIWGACSQTSIDPLALLDETITGLREAGRGHRIGERVDACDLEDDLIRPLKILRRDPIFEDLRCSEQRRVTTRPNLILNRHRGGKGFPGRPDETYELGDVADRDQPVEFCAELLSPTVLQLLRCHPCVAEPPGIGRRDFEVEKKRLERVLSAQRLRFDERIPRLEDDPQLRLRGREKERIRQDARCRPEVLIGNLELIGFQG
jgi:hypothetical protein